jgi:tetratricopeptide (TPR) repeat protein
MKIIKTLIILSALTFLGSCQTYKSNYDIDDIRDRYVNNILKNDDSDAAEIAYQYVVEANQAKMKNDYAFAILKYQEALKYDSSAVILYDIARCYNELRMYDPAITYATNAIKKEPDLAESYKELSTAFLFTYQTEDGLNALKEYTMRKPTDDNIYSLARIYHNLQYYDEALHYYNELYNKREDAFLLINIAHIYLQKKDTVLYLEYSKKAYRGDPSQNNLVTDVLAYYWEQKDYDKIYETLCEYEEIAPSSQYTTVFADVLETFNDSLNVEQSKEIIPRFIDKVDFDMLDNNRVAFFTLAYAWKVADTIKTRQVCDYIIENKLDNNHLAKMSFIQFSTTNEADRKRSLEVADRCIAIHPEDPEFLFTKAQTLFFDKRYTDAIVPLEKAVEIDSMNVDYWNFLGYIYHEAGELTMSDTAYTTSLRINPNYPVTNNDYAYYLAEREERLVYAHSLAKKAILYSPKNSSFLDTYAWVCYKMKNYDTAIEYLGKALNFAEEHNMEAIYEHFAVIYKDMGEFQKAIEMFTKALEYTKDKQDEFTNEIDALRSNQSE